MWLETLLEKITSFIPRIMIIRPDESGFRQTMKPWGGCWITETKPGNWYWLLPIVMEEEVCKIKPQVVDIRSQSILTKDNIDIMVSASIRYYVRNAVKALLEVLDYDESLQTTALVAIEEYIEGHTLEELKNSRSTLRENLLKAVREESKGWGLWVSSVGITDIGKARNFRLLGNLGS